jgi:hypothetical protein
MLLSFRSSKVKMDREVLQKFDARSRQAVEEGRLQGDVEFQLRAGAPLQDAELQRLTQAGCRLYSTVGRLASGVAEAGQVTAVAELPFVEQIELSKDLFME